MLYFPFSETTPNIALIIKLLCFAPDITGTQGRVSGKRQFTVRRKNADTVIGPRILRFQQKGGFAEVCPAGKTVHFLIRHIICINHHRQRIAEQRYIRKNIDLVKLISAGIQRYYPFYVLTEQS